MLLPKFKITKDERLFITPLGVSNGHWYASAEYLKSPQAHKAFAALKNIPHGNYTMGYCEVTNGAAPINIAQIFPKRDGYLPLKPAPQAVEFRGENSISSYIYKTNAPLDVDNFEIGINTDYVPLMLMGHAFAKDAIFAHNPAR